MTGETLAKATAASALLAGPALTAAEASGALQDASRPFVSYLMGAGLTLIGAMFSALLWFFKREHASITGGIGGLRKDLHEHTTSVAALALSVERGFAELRGEVARRMLIEEHGRSSARIHEKVNKLGRSMAFLAGKLGLPLGEVGHDSSEDKGE